MLVWVWAERAIGGGGGGARWIWVAGGGGGGGGRWNVGVAVGVTAMAGVALVAALVISSRRGSLKSPWSRRKRKQALTKQQWESFFTEEGKLRDGGVKFLKKVQSGGIDPSIRAEVWPFLLGVYDLNSTEAERLILRKERRRQYEKLRRRCRRLLKHTEDGDKKSIDEIVNAESPNSNVGTESEDMFSGRLSLSTEQGGLDNNDEDQCEISHAGSKSDSLKEEDENETPHVEASAEEESAITHVDASLSRSESSGAQSSSEEETESMETDSEHTENTHLKELTPQSGKTTEDFDTWLRIIRLDAVRANAEWVIYSPTQAAVSEGKVLKCAASVGLKDYDHLEPCRIYHASRLVAVLGAYALYDQEIGYCQGMSDLLSPILAIIEEDDLAFWCFVSFMRKARHNFRLDEVGIRRQLNIISKIIKSKDSHLYRHLEKLQAEDCFFVYRMVVVLFRRELDFEQTLCLWEVMWADQAAIRAGFGKSAWGRIRLRAPPTDDLLLYAIAACVLQRRKLIIESYSSMDEIIRECNNMAGNLDVWKLLDNAYDLVVTLHDKI